MKTHADLYPGTDPNCPALQAPIEPGVQPLCDALNALPDTYTLWSCEGHPEMASTPFVTFIAPQETAFKLSKIIECSPFLKFNWTMSAWFREDGSLQYTVRPDDSRLIRKGIFGWWPRMHWSYAEMCVELTSLAQLISHKYGFQINQEYMNKEMLVNQKRIFPNAAPMEKKEAEKLMMRIIIFSFSFGLLKVKNIGVSKNVFFHGCEAAFLVSMVASQEIFSASMWPSVIWMLFMSAGSFLIFRIKNSKDPEAAMQDQVSSLIFKTIK